MKHAHPRKRKKIQDEALERSDSCQEVFKDFLSRAVPRSGQPQPLTILRRLFRESENVMHVLCLLLVTWHRNNEDTPSAGRRSQSKMTGKLEVGGTRTSQGCQLASPCRLISHIPPAKSPVL